MLTLWIWVLAHKNSSYGDSCVWFFYMFVYFTNWYLYLFHNLSLRTWIHYIVTIYLLSTYYINLVHKITVGQKLYAQHSSYWMKKNIIYKMSCKRTSTPIVPYMWWQATSWHPKDKIQTGEIIQVTWEVRTNCICFYHMWWVWVRAWRRYPINIVYRCTTKEAIQSKACWWHLKVKVRSQWQVTSFTDWNAKGWTVMMNI